MSVKEFESLKRQVNLLLYLITKSPGAADAGTLPTAMRTSSEALCHVETLANLSLDNILLQEKKIVALLSITVLISLLLICIKTCYKYYLESESLIFFSELQVLFKKHLKLSA